MAELFYDPEDREFRKLSDIELLNELGFSFVTPAKQIKRHSAQRMEKFDNYNSKDPVQRRARVIDVAYYALELSTPLRPFDAAMSAVEKLEADQREASQQIIDDLLMAMKVDEILSRAYEVTSTYEFSQLQELKRRTAPYTPTTTGSLAILHNMTIPSKKLGYISGATARQSENLLRAAIAAEKGIEFPL